MQESENNNKENDLQSTPENENINESLNPPMPTEEDRSGPLPTAPETTPFEEEGEPVEEGTEPVEESVSSKIMPINEEIQEDEAETVEEKNEAEMIPEAPSQIVKPNYQYIPPVQDFVYQDSMPPQGIHPKNGMAIASMVLGIISCALFCIWFLSIPCGIVGLILGVVALKAGKSGIAKAGVITSIVGLALVIVVWGIFIITALTRYGTPYHNFNWR